MNARDFTFHPKTLSLDRQRCQEQQESVCNTTLKVFCGNALAVFPLTAMQVRRRIRSFRFTRLQSQAHGARQMHGLELWHWPLTSTDTHLFGHYLDKDKGRTFNLGLAHISPMAEFLWGQLSPGTDCLTSS